MSCCAAFDSASRQEQQRLQAELDAAAEREAAAQRRLSTADQTGARGVQLRQGCVGVQAHTWVQHLLVCERHCAI